MHFGTLYTSLIKLTGQKTYFIQAERLGRRQANRDTPAAGGQPRQAVCRRQSAGQASGRPADAA